MNLISPTAKQAERRTSAAAFRGDRMGRLKVVDREFSGWGTEAAQFYCGVRKIEPSPRVRLVRLEESRVPTAFTISNCWLAFVEPLDPDIERWFEATTFCWNLENIVHSQVRMALRVQPTEESEGEQTEEALYQEIAQNFWGFDKVHAVYVQRYQGELFVHVVLAVAKFDRSLMESLFSTEYDLRVAHPETVFSFLYPPVGEIWKDSYMHPKARCLFSR